MSENQNIEWKESWRDEYLKWICGFANADGGKLIIGRDDKGTLVGVADAKKLLVDLPNKVRDILGIMVDVNLREHSKKQEIEILVESYPYPVSYKGEYHYRSGSTKQELKGAALDRFLLEKQGKHWDGVPVPKVSIKDLSNPAIDNFRKNARRSRRLNEVTLKEPAKSLIEKLHLLDGTYLKRAALLLFHPDPEHFVTGAYVKIGYFRSNSDLAYQDDVHGNLFEQVERTIELLTTKYLKAGIEYQGIQRGESLPVPEAALREAVLNSIVHKDYSSGTPVQFSVYSDKLVIWNPGKLPQHWTIKKLQSKHPSRPFNPDVANAFFRAGLIEAWGRGIERMLEACRLAGTPKPVIRADADGLWVEFSFSKAYLARVVAQKVEPQLESRLESRLESQLESRLESQLESQLESRLAARIVLALKAEEAGKAKLAGRLGHTTVSGELHKQIRRLLKDGWIEMTLPSRPNSRMQKYRLTPKAIDQVATNVGKK